jgi:hypothetical protein
VALAARRPRLIVGLWLWQLALALTATLPVFQWLRDTTAIRPAADRLLDRFSLADVIDIVRTSAGSVVATWNAALGGAMLLTVVTAPIVLAVTVAALRDPDHDSSLTMRGPGECYWRLLLLTVVGRGIAIVVAGIGTIGVMLALSSIRERTDWSFPVVIALAGGVGACIAALLWAVVDVGICAIVHGRARGAFAGWWIGLRTVWRMPAFIVFLWALSGVATLAALLVLAAGTASLPATTLPLIALMAALHQSFAVWRAVLRVGVLSAEMNAWAAVWPEPAPPMLSLADDDPASVHDEEHPGPGQDREREIDDRETGE